MAKTNYSKAFSDAWEKMGEIVMQIHEKYEGDIVDDIWDKYAEAEELLSEVDDMIADFDKEDKEES